MTCDICGAQVMPADTEKHNEWHKNNDVPIEEDGLKGNETETGQQI